MGNKIARRSLLAGLGLGAGAFLAACAGARYAATPTPARKPTEAPEPTEASKPTAQAGGAAAPVTLTFLSWSAADSPSRKVDVALTEEYMKANPGVTVKTDDVPFDDYLKRLRTMFAAGVGPDVLWDSIWRQPKLVQAGSIIALDDLVKGAAGAELAIQRGMSFPDASRQTIPTYAPAALEMGRYRGKLYGLPLASSTWVLLYNATLFAEAGLKNPGELKAANRWSFDALKDAALKIGRREGDRLVTEGYLSDRQAYTWMNYAHNNGAQFVDKTGAGFAVDSKESVEALQWLADFVLTSKVSPNPTDRQGGDDVQRFGTGRLAMMTTWAGSAIDVKRVVKDRFQYDVIDLPVNRSGRESGGYWHANLINISSRATSRDHAWGLGRLAASARAEVMRIEAGQLNTPLIDDPRLIETYRKTSPVKNGLVVVDLLKRPVPLPYNESWEEQRVRVVEPYMADVYDERKKIADTIADTNKKLNELSPKD